MRHYAFLVASLFMVAVAGCGGGGESVEALDTTKPLEGRDLRKAGDLEGRWMALNVGPFIAVEFMDEGKALVTPESAARGGPESMLFNYTILEGGRLSMVSQSTLDEFVFTANIGDDQIELVNGRNTQRMKRVPEGQTLEQAFEAANKIREAESQRIYKALEEFIKSPDLVVESTSQTPGGPPAMALEMPGLQGVAGKAWYDDDTPHLDNIHAELGDAPGATAPAIELRFGQQIQPPTREAPQGGGLSFTMSGTVENPTFTSEVSYGNGEYVLALRRDAARHREIVAKFDAEIARVAAQLKPMTDLLKDFAVLEGTSSSDNNFYPKGYADYIVLTRDPATGVYSGQGSYRIIDSGATQQWPRMDAEIQIIDDKPVLFISAPSAAVPARQHQLSLENGKLTGGWFASGSQQGYAAELTVTRAVDNATRERETAAKRQALEALSGKTFVGYIKQFPTLDYGQISLARVTLTRQPNGAFSAVVRYPVMNGTETMTGGIADTAEGPVLGLAFQDFDIGGQRAGGGYAQVFGQLRNQPWQLDLGAPRAGKVVLAAVADNVAEPFELVEVDDAWFADQRRAISTALAAGMQFKTTIPEDDGSRIQLKLDPATSNVTGELVTGGRQTSYYGRVQYVGKLGEGDGFPLLTLDMDSPTGSRAPLDAKGGWHAVQTADGLLLKGWVINNQNRYQNQSEWLAVK